MTETGYQSGTNPCKVLKKKVFKSHSSYLFKGFEFDGGSSRSLRLFGVERHGGKEVEEHRRKDKEGGKWRTGEEGVDVKGGKRRERKVFKKFKIFPQFPGTQFFMVITLQSWQFNHDSSNNDDNENDCDNAD